MTIPTNDNLAVTTEESSNKQGLKSIGQSMNGDQGVDSVYRKTPNTNRPMKRVTNKKKKIHALDVYIIFCFICIIIYTIVHTIIFYKLGIEATVLDALFYGVFGGEVLLCALLKRLKLKQEFELTKINKKDENEFVE